MEFPAVLLPKTAFIAALFSLAFANSSFAQGWIFSAPIPGDQAIVASSADGTRLSVISYWSGWLLASTNSGATWNSNSLPVIHWTSLACSADGVKLVAATSECAVYTSTNSGATWTFSATLSGGSGCFVASSADGTKLVTAALTYVADEGTYGRIYTSINSGASWNLRLNGADGLYGPTVFSAVASSADGANLFATSKAEQTGFPPYYPIPGDILISLGNTPSFWFPRPLSFNWTSIASSADGTNVVAVASSYLGLPSTICTSTNAGIDWKSNNAPSALWTSTASSADGAKLVAVASNGPIYTSTDFGATWISNIAPALNWTSVASSADGTKLVAASPQGIYVSQPAPALNIDRSGGNLILSWPSSALALGLQENADLTTTDWTAVATSPVFTNGQYQVILNPTNDSRFFRLKYP